MARVQLRSLSRAEWRLLQNKLKDLSLSARIHERYRIDAVPLVVIADERGVVRTSFLGPVTATDLWAGVAAARDT